ncbi:hypothetical protein GKZ90_0001530 [Flavobacterium sp. MC2016-06]|uniref:hypothetical protein n=1 Tax=Flavobacterium sp. MC2016-06 TaxID=2676308 RepID=UPI0012BA5ABD|nr:hypothetical protein [Flavobacterium sp. MC2016-06]MBU3859006.1 hypothetical protein [Flavobacterium sp. MC2016-06]
MSNQLKKIKISIGVCLFVITAHSQQIGNGLADIINDFTVPLVSGAYNGLNPTGTLPESDWQHLFVVRHPNPTNNYQLQIASTIATNDRLYFRKLASGSAISVNPIWYELATRGKNNFIGDQIIVGNVGIGTQNPTEKFEIYNSDTTPAVISLKSFRNDSQFVDVGRISAKQSTVEIARIGMPRSGGALTGYLTFWTKADNNVDLTEKVRIAENGNVGIGTINPTSKLTVAGNINSREVKVSVDAGADFVFDSNYKLPSLQSIDKYIKENRHLPEIASAEKMQKEGINLSEMNIKLLQKIEELTIYVIEQNTKINELQEQNRKVIDLEKRLEKLEKN